MKLILPFPPSVNTYWRHPNKGAFAGKSLISEAGRKFQSAACAAIVEQLRRLPKPTSAPASVEIVLFPPDTGFHNVLREVVKHSRSGESVIKEEWVKELCQHCHGKGEVSTACRGCKGKGIVLDEKRTRLHGTPVYKICGRCNGNRFSRLPTTLARHHVQKLVPALTDYQWYKGYADIIDKLVTKCWQEEAYAETQLRKVTR